MPGWQSEHRRCSLSGRRRFDTDSLLELLKEFIAQLPKTERAVAETDVAELVSDIAGCDIKLLHSGQFVTEDDSALVECDLTNIGDADYETDDDE